ncbi:MAG: c-type cytochrome [Acidobacteria bacterium]|nr:c-type cytochrome [Acidobacteriota bacterium]
MRIFIKTLVLLVCCVAAIAAGGFTYLMLGYPKVGPAPDVTIERTSERIARGKYLADHVAACTDCHSQRDWARYAGPVKDGTYGAGGEVFDESMGMPGRVVSRNITPGALGDWTDGEILRAMTAGVSRDGSPLFPLMPYLDYGAHMDPEDAKAIVSYLRTIPASSHAPEPTRLNFPLPLIVRTMPQQPARVATRPATDDRVAQGEYLVQMAGCTHCHTPMDDSRQPLPGRTLAGGTPFAFPNGVVARAANLTPHASGIGAWTEADFVQRFKSAAVEPQLVVAGGFNTPMPWQAYAGMTSDDLGAIYAYLRTLPAVDHAVEKVGYLQAGTAIP